MEILSEDDDDQHKYPSNKRDGTQNAYMVCTRVFIGRNYKICPYGCVHKKLKERAKEYRETIRNHTIQTTRAW